MRFAIMFAGLMIAISVDAEALFNHFAFWFIYPALFFMLYIDLVTLSLDNKEALKKITEEVKKKTNDLSPPGSNGTH